MAFLLDTSEGGGEGVSALSLLFEGGEDENDAEAEEYSSLYSDTYMQALKLSLTHQILILSLNVKLLQQLNLVSDLCLL